MHDSAGYTFHGDAPISGLTPAEINTLLLGHLTRQREAQPDSGPMDSHKQEIERGQQQAREEMLQDLGFQ